MRDYPTLYLDTNSSKGTACSEKEDECKWTWGWIVSHVHLHPYSFSLQAVPLLEFVS
jgi:hypothetical protein